MSLESNRLIVTHGSNSRSQREYTELAKNSRRWRGDKHVAMDCFTVDQTYYALKNEFVRILADIESCGSLCLLNHLLRREK